MTTAISRSQERGHDDRLTFDRFLPVAECRSALEAARDLAAVLANAGIYPPSLLFLHGPPGTGKSHLVNALVDEVLRQAPDRIARSASASQLGDLARTPDEPAALESADLLVVEDVHLLASRHARHLVELCDIRGPEGLPTVVTSAAGPRQLISLPQRLTSRLAGGLVVALEPFSTPSRLKLLERKSAERRLKAQPAVLAWLAEHLPGNGRQIEAAVNQLELLVKVQKRNLEIEELAVHFHDLVDARRPSVERIIRRVCRHYGLEPKQLHAKQRRHAALLPRQIGMYLARALTGLSLGEIGGHFGRRDHTTVLHACRKITAALAEDPYLCGTVRQLQAELS